jgi:hypothetical protein
MSVLIVVMYPKHRGVVVTKKCDGSNYFLRTGSSEPVHFFIFMKKGPFKGPQANAFYCQAYLIEVITVPDA